MLKYVFLAGAMTLSAPAFAQDMPGQQTTPQTSQTAPATTDQPAPDQTAPDQAVPAAPQSATPATPASAAPAADSTVVQDTTTAAAQPAGGAQIADVVNSEFATYDKDADGTLNAAEFGNWMVALKTASDPATKAGSKETKTWLGQAFAQADTDKSKSVSKTELTGFLSAAA